MNVCIYQFTYLSAYVSICVSISLPPFISFCLWISHVCASILYHSFPTLTRIILSLLSNPTIFPSFQKLSYKEVFSTLCNYCSSPFLPLSLYLSLSSSDTLSHTLSLKLSFSFTLSLLLFSIIIPVRNQCIRPCSLRLQEIVMHHCCSCRVHIWGEVI